MLTRITKDKHEGTIRCHFSVLAIFIAGCGPQDAQPTQPTGSSPLNCRPNLRHWPHTRRNQRQPHNRLQLPLMSRRQLAHRRPRLRHAQPPRRPQRPFHRLRLLLRPLNTKWRFCVRCPPGTSPACHRAYEPMTSFGNSWDSSPFTTILKKDPRNSIACPTAASS